jgi:hypothetical protein
MGNNASQVVFGLSIYSPMAPQNAIVGAAGISGDTFVPLLTPTTGGMTDRVLDMSRLT